MVQEKTNAMRILEAKRISYRALTYESKDGKIDGVSVAKKIARNPAAVYKTLVAQGSSRNLVVFVIPVDAELDLKKAAKAAEEKKIELIPVKDIQKWTGYIRGGCSPIGMKKMYTTFIDKQAAQLENIIVSGGKIGIQIELSTVDLNEITNAIMCELIK